MAINPGQRFVRRHQAARGSTSNTAAADIAYDTAVISEGGYSYAAPEVTVDTAGLYLCLFDIGEVQLNSTRAVGTLVPTVNGVQQQYYKARHRYTRNSGGNHNVSFGVAFLDLAVNDTVKIRNPGNLSGTDALGSYATNIGNGGGFQLIKFNDGNFTEVRRTSSQSPIAITYANTTRPWTDSTATWTQLTFNSEVRDDADLYSSGGDVNLEANKKYAIVYGATFDGSSSQRHTHHLALDIGGTRVQHSTGYERNNASDGPPMQGIYFHETGGSPEAIGIYGAVEQEDSGVSNTVGCDNAYLQVLELPNGAEWIHVDNGATDSLVSALAGTSTYYDTPLSVTFRPDGDSDLALGIGGSNYVQNDSGGTLPVLSVGWHLWDRDSASSGTRKHVWAYWDNGGSRLGYGISGGYNRGQQGNDDTHRLGFVGAATFDLVDGENVSYACRDPVSGSNSNMGIYASGGRHFLGLQVFKLDTLDAGAAPSQIQGSTVFALDSTPQASGKAGASASQALNFGDSGNVGATGSLQGSTSIAVSQAGSVAGKLQAQGNTILSVSEAGQVSGSSDLQAGVGVSFTSSPEIKAGGDLAGASSINFQESGTGQNISFIQGIQLVEFLPSPTINGGSGMSGMRGGTTLLPFRDTAILDICDPFYISLSTNVAPGGEDTTQRLTGGGTHGGGRIQDDQNPADSVDLGLDESGEWAWVLKPSACAVRDQAYSFRLVFADDSELNTYSVTPQWTIPAGDSIAVDTTLQFDTFGDLGGVYRIESSVILTFDTTADLVATGALASSTSINFSTGGTLSEITSIAGSTQITFATSGELSQIANIFGATSLVFSETGNISGIGELIADEPVIFTTAGDARSRMPIASAASIDFSVVGDLDICIPFVISLSTNVTPGGEDTTQRLTGGGVHGGGRIQDDKNPADSVDLGSNESGEWAWVLKGSGCELDGLGYEFRLVFDDDTPLDTYTEIPEWIVDLEGELRASTSLSFSTSGNLVGKASIEAAETLLFSSIADITARAAIASSASINFATTADITATAAINGASLIEFDANGTLFSEGALFGSVGIVFDTNAEIKGAGALSALETITFTALGTLASQGDLVGSATIQFTTDADLTSPGSGFIRGATDLTFTTSGTLDALASIVGASQITFDTAGNLFVRNPIAGDATLNFTTNGDLAAIGQLIGDESIIFTPNGDISAPGTLSASESIIFTVGGALVGGSTIFATITIEFDPNGRLSYGGIAVPPQRVIDVIGKDRDLETSGKNRNLATTGRKAIETSGCGRIININPKDRELK